MTIHISATLHEQNLQFDVENKLNFCHHYLRNDDQVFIFKYIRSISLALAYYNLELDQSMSLMYIDKMVETLFLRLVKQITNIKWNLIHLLKDIKCIMQLNEYNQDMHCITLDSKAFTFLFKRNVSLYFLFHFITNLVFSCKQNPLSYKTLYRDRFLSHERSIKCN